jgi:hypothetical protein
MRRSGFVTLAICSVLTLASATGWSAPTDAHDIYMALKNRFGQSCCNEGDCRPAHYRTTANGVQMLVDGDGWPCLMRRSNTAPLKVTQVKHAAAIGVVS